MLDEHVLELCPLQHMRGCRKQLDHRRRHAGFHTRPDEDAADATGPWEQADKDASHHSRRKKGRFNESSPVVERGVRAWVRARVFMCVRACVRACVCTYIHVYMCYSPSSAKFPLVNKEPFHHIVGIPNIACNPARRCDAAIEEVGMPW
jgi:hypothetical protein